LKTQFNDINRRSNLLRP